MSNFVKFALGGLAAGYLAITGYVYSISSSTKEPTVVEVPVKTEVAVPAESQVRPAEPISTPEPAPVAEAPAPATRMRATAPATPVRQDKPKSYARKAGEAVKKSVGKTVDTVVNALENPGKASLGSCSSSHDRYNDPKCGWAREVLAEQGILRYKMDYESKYGIGK